MADLLSLLQACKCVKAWVQFGVPMESCDVIVDTLLNCVSDEELQDTVLEALSSLVSHPDTHKYPHTLMDVLKKLLPLDRVMHQYMAEGSYEMCLPVLSLFITFGESHSRLLIGKLSLSCYYAVMQAVTAPDRLGHQLRRGAGRGAPPDHLHPGRLLLPGPVPHPGDHQRDALRVLVYPPGMLLLSCHSSFH